jgi:hypothetical protein
MLRDREICHKRQRRLSAHSVGSILKPRQQGVSGRNEAITYALADQPQRVAGALPRQLERMVEQLQQRCNAGGRTVVERVANVVFRLAVSTCQGRLLLRADGELLVTVQRPAHSGRSRRRAMRRAGTPASQLGQSRQGG